METLLVDGKVKKERPYFMPVIHPIIIKSEEKHLVYRYERQTWKPYMKIG